MPPIDVSKILSNIEKKQTRVSVVGLGYVGLPLAVEFARGGFHVTGFDVLQHKVDAVNRGENYIPDIPNELLADLVKKGMLKASSDYSLLKEQDAVSICVPTPLNKTGDPDLSYILNVLKEVKTYLHSGQIIILESTTYPGTTEEVLLPELEEAGLICGKDFYLAFSPERVDPGNEKYQTYNTPKIIGGVTPTCSQVSAALYASIIENVIPVSSTRAAEMVKLLENTFRSINIGLVNELAIICNLLKVDVWEVIEAAASKPFGFMPFFPGPGLGGHCIPIDPSYLSWKLRALNYRTRFIELARDINLSMPGYVVQKVADALNALSKPVRGANIMILGVSYKRNIDDVRESPAFDIIRLLREKGGEITYHDPYVPSFSFEGEPMSSVDLSAAFLGSQDCVVIVTDHTNVDYAWVLNQSTLVVDSRNATKNIRSGKAIIVKL